MTNHNTAVTKRLQIFDKSSRSSVKQKRLKYRPLLLNKVNITALKVPISSLANKAGTN